MNKRQNAIILTALFGLLFSAVNLSATKTKISCTAPSYSGEEIVFFSYSNMISFNEIELCRSLVDDSGRFECEFDLNQTHIIFTNLGVYNCFFYVDPGFEYQIRLPEKRLKSEAEEQNPYFEPLSVQLAVKPTVSLSGKPLPQTNEELNFNIRAFNDSFYPYYYKYVISAYTNNIDRKELDQVIETILSPFLDIQHHFFKTYVKYRIGLLQYYGNQQSTKTIADEYFRTAEICYNNPSYMELFNNVFGNYFDNFSAEHPDSRIGLILNRENNYSKANELLKKDQNLENDQLRELVFLKGIYDGFYGTGYSKSAMLILLDSVLVKSQYDIHHGISTDIMRMITKLLPGYKPPDFELYDRDSNLISLEYFKDQYIYLGFCNSFSYYCIKEYELLRNLNKRHKEHLMIITILVDDSYQKMIELVDYNKYDWIFLHFSNQPEILDNYDVKAYPTYYLIGPDGNLLLSPAPSPLEDFEGRLFQIMRARGDI